jgi:hypothetical protein
VVLRGRREGKGERAYRPLGVAAVAMRLTPSLDTAKPDSKISMEASSIPGGPVEYTASITTCEKAQAKRGDGFGVATASRVC